MISPRKQLSWTLLATGWVFYLVTLGLYGLLVYAVYELKFTFYDRAEGDTLVLGLGAAIVLMQSFFFTAMLKHKLYWLAIPIAVVCWLSLYKASLHITRIQGADTRWEVPLQERLGSPRSTRPL